MPEQEPKAAKAGRFVRTMGLAFQREFERKAAETAAARAARPAAPPPPPPAPPPPAVPTTGLFAKTTFGLFVLSLVGLALAALRADTLLPGSGETVARSVVAVVLLIEAYLLCSNWHLANQRLVQRVLNRVWGPRGAMTRREKAFSRALRDVVTLIGIVFLAGGVYEILAATHIGS